MAYYRFYIIPRGKRELIIDNVLIDAAEQTGASIVRMYMRPNAENYWMIEFAVSLGDDTTLRDFQAVIPQDVELQGWEDINLAAFQQGYPLIYLRREDGPIAVAAIEERIDFARRNARNSRWIAARLMMRGRIKEAQQEIEHYRFE
jgi:hypothetical protein